MYFHTLLFCLCTHLSSGSVLNPFRTTYLHILLYRAKGNKCLFHLKQAPIAMVTTYISLLSSAFIQMNSGTRHRDVGGGRSLAALMRPGLRDLCGWFVRSPSGSLAAFGSERAALFAFGSGARRDSVREDAQSLRRLLRRGRRVQAGLTGRRVLKCGEKTSRSKLGGSTPPSLPPSLRCTRLEIRHRESWSELTETAETARALLKPHT